VTYSFQSTGLTRLRHLSLPFGTRRAKKYASLTDVDVRIEYREPLAAHPAVTGVRNGSA
jgi:hypothetical protein